MANVRETRCLKDFEALYELERGIRRCRARLNKLSRVSMVSRFLPVHQTLDSTV